MASNANANRRRKSNSKSNARGRKNLQKANGVIGHRVTEAASQFDSRRPKSDFAAQSTRLHPRPEFPVKLAASSVIWRTSFEASVEKTDAVFANPETASVS